MDNGHMRNLQLACLHSSTYKIAMLFLLFFKKPNSKLLYIYRRQSWPIDTTNHLNGNSCLESSWIYDVPHSVPGWNLLVSCRPGFRAFLSSPSSYAAALLNPPTLEFLQLRQTYEEETARSLSNGEHLKEQKWINTAWYAFEKLWNNMADSFPWAFCVSRRMILMMSSRGMFITEGCKRRAQCQQWQESSSALTFSTWLLCHTSPTGGGCHHEFVQWNWVWLRVCHGLTMHPRFMPCISPSDTSRHLWNTHTHTTFCLRPWCCKPHRPEIVPCVKSKGTTPQVHKSLGGPGWLSAFDGQMMGLQGSGWGAHGIHHEASAKVVVWQMQATKCEHGIEIFWGFFVVGD